MGTSIVVGLVIVGCMEIVNLAIAWQITRRIDDIEYKHRQDWLEIAPLRERMYYWQAMSSGNKGRVGIKPWAGSDMPVIENGEGAD